MTKTWVGEIERVAAIRQQLMNSIDAFRRARSEMLDPSRKCAQMVSAVDSHVMHLVAADVELRALMQAYEARVNIIRELLELNGTLVDEAHRDVLCRKRDKSVAQKVTQT